MELDITKKSDVISVASDTPLVIKERNIHTTLLGHFEKYYDLDISLLAEGSYHNGR
jgi:hypothetical protein